MQKIKLPLNWTCYFKTWNSKIPSVRKLSRQESGCSGKRVSHWIWIYCARRATRKGALWLVDWYNKKRFWLDNLLAKGESCHFITRTSRGQNKRTNTDYKKWQRGQSDFLLGHWIRIFLFLKEWENNFGVSFAKIFNYCRLHSALLQKTAALAELGHAQNFRPHSGKFFCTSALLKTIRKYLWIYFYFFLIFWSFFLHYYYHCYRRHHQYCY